MVNLLIEQHGIIRVSIQMKTHIDKEQPMRSVVIKDTLRLPALPSENKILLERGGTMVMEVAGNAISVNGFLLLLPVGKLNTAAIAAIILWINVAAVSQLPQLRIEAVVQKIIVNIRVVIISAILLGGPISVRTKNGVSDHGGTTGAQT
jgi:hypothetical protein